MLGEQIKAWVILAGERDGTLLEITEGQRTAERVAKAAQIFVDAKIAIAIEFLCTEAIEAALPMLKDAKSLSLPSAFVPTA